MNSDIGFDIKLLKGKIGTSDNEKNVRTERIELYHELLNEVENHLIEKKLLRNLNRSLKDDGKGFNDFLNNVPNYTYIKANGWSSFEDFEKFKTIMSNFNEIQRLIYVAGIENHPDIIKQKQEINELKSGLKKANNTKN